MNRRPRRLLTLALLLGASALVAQASTPRSWQVSTQAEWLKGEVERLSIDDAGRLGLGPVMRPLHEATVPFIWCLAPGPDGAVFAGTGNDGQVLRIDRQGRSRVFFDATELEVHALAAAPDGSLYVATSPGGRVYRVDARGTATVAFDPDDKYIWALALDPRGRLYVGTGEKGLIYRVAGDGTSEVFYRTNATHATALAFDRQGNVLASTESPGRVLRIDPAGKAFVVLDSPFRELRAVRVDGAGQIYVAAVNGKPAAEDRPATPPPSEPVRPAGVPSVSTEIVSIAVMDVPGMTGTAPSAARAQEKPVSKGAVYRISPEGGWEMIWESRDDLPYDLMLEDGGSLLVATGNAGKVYRVAGNPARATLVTRLGGQQVTAMLAAGGARYFSTSNPAKVFEMARDRSPDGSYISDVKDAGSVASWGTLSWHAVERGAARVQIFTRAGNTSTPDETWSAWSGPYQHADGDGVTSPAARYLQWKAVLSAPPEAASGPSLVSVRMAYLQRNLRPTVTTITIQPPGIVYQRPFSTGEPEIAGMSEAPAEARTPVFSAPLGGGAASPASGPALGRRLYQKGLQAVTWKADDDNEDRLQYDAYFRKFDDAAWKPLRRDMIDQILVWDTTSVPDGTYLIRIVASDGATNPADVALSGELESDAFDVDNSPPVISVAQISKDGTRTAVIIDVRDTHSAIGHVEYSVDAGRWQAVYPVDGSADSRSERFEFSVEGNASGGLVIRASDALANTASAAVEAPREKAH